jgi:predicted nuclease of predicted toxin-antitoxin system
LRWLADERIDLALVQRLRGFGHDVRYMAEGQPGATDLEVIRLAQSKNRLLLTEDKGFGELVFRSRVPAPGIVLLRIDPEKHELKWRRLEAAISRYGDRLWGRHLVVEEARFRSRPLLRQYGAGSG